jgi:hypothetical protein
VHDVGVQGVDTGGDRGEGGLGGLAGIAQAGVVSGQGGAAGDELDAVEAGQIVTQVLRCGGEQAVQLVERRGAGLDRAAAGHPQRPDRFDRSSAGLRGPRRLLGHKVARAASASSGSDLPSARRARRSGRSTSTRTTPKLLR